jgi:hypothetical protein
MAKLVENKERVVLAYGEVTGHCHQFTTKEAKEFSADNRRFIKLEQDAKLRHEEHSTITFPKGSYEIIQQVQYTPEEIKAVVD